MFVLIGVALVSTAGWIVSLTCPRSAARRHFVLLTALAACLLLPIALVVRSSTDWTVMVIRSSPTNADGMARESVTPLRKQPVEGEVSIREQAEDGDVSFVRVAPGAVRETTGQHVQRTSVRHQATAESDVVAPTTFRQPDRVEPPLPATWDSVQLWGVVAYTFVTSALLLRLLSSLAAVQRLKRCAVEMDALSAGIRVLEADVAVPLALGFGRPAIVLPRGFREEAGPEVLQDVLAHEAEHLRRGDHWIMLLQRIAAAVYWPIVTVHLLNRALIRAREELCDNAVLARRDPAAYGQTLLAVAAKISGNGGLLAHAAPSVLRRGELERRIAGLFDERRDRRTRVSPRVGRMAAASLLTVAVLAATTRIAAVAEEPPAGGLDAAAPEPTVTPAGQGSIAWTGIPTVPLEDATLHRGVVLAPDGKPLPGASIYAASTIELLELAAAEEVGVEDLGPVRAVTDAEGRFEFKAEDLSWVTPAGERKRWETLLVTTKEGLASGWLKTWGADRSFRSHWHPMQSREVAVRMRPPATLTGHLLLEGGEPLAGARVQLTGLMAPVEYDLNTHVPQEEENALAMFSTVDYAETLYRPWVLPGLLTEATTGENGRFELSGLPEGFIARIEITHPEAVTTDLRVAVRPIEPVYRKPYVIGEQAVETEEPTPTLHGSGFTAELPRGAVLRGQVTSGWLENRQAAAGVTVARANHNAPTGMYGQQFTTDAEGHFEVTGLPDDPQGYDLAFVGSFDAPFASRRERVIPGVEAEVTLTKAVPYRLKLTDPAGNPIDRDVYSIQVQQTPGSTRHDIKSRFNVAERVAPGVFQGIVPVGPGAVLVKRGARTDRPAAVDPKAFFEPGRTDWTLEEERYAYGDPWRIARPAVIRGGNATSHAIDQLDLAAVVFTKAANDGVLELTATVYSDPPVEVTLVDEAGKLVAGAEIRRQLERYNADGLPATFSVYGLHPERAEFLEFTHEERRLIGTLSTTWTSDPVRVVMRPAATLIGRFTDASGEPDKDFGVRVLGEQVMPETFVAGRVYNTTENPGERKGEFRLAVPPGAEVRGEFVRKTPDWETRPSVAPAFGPLTPDPGETVDLGRLAVP